MTGTYAASLAQPLDMVASSSSITTRATIVIPSLTPVLPATRAPLSWPFLSNLKGLNLER